MSTSPKGHEEDVVREVCAMVEKRIGIHFGPRQYSMVQGRLRRRMFELHIDSLEMYRNYVAREPSEIEALVSLLTTHYSYFFREFVHFEELEASLSALAARARARGSDSIEVLSAGCSRGQEVYSLAMHLAHHLPDAAPGMKFSILGTDVDPESVKIAANGVFRHSDIKAVPAVYIGKHWARGTKEISDFVKAKKSIRDNCQFAVLNLLDLSPFHGRKFDAIFCRNVFIYFSLEQVKTVATALMKHLQPGGLLFLGLTESLHGMEIPLKVLGPSVYGRSEDVIPSIAPAAAPTPRQLPAAAKLPVPLRVACIDDSPSILAILNGILSDDGAFEIVGTAKNGEEGLSLVERTKPDVITLDLHMPICDGLEFLRRRQGGPPVVVVSSVSREDANLAFESLRLGAADYVEKPSLSNMEQRSDELKAKLKAAWRGRNSPAQVTVVDQEFKRKQVIKEPATCARVILFSLADQEKCAKILREVRASGVSVFVAVEGANTVLPEIRERLAKGAGVEVLACSSPGSGKVFLGDWQETVKEVAGRGFTRVSVMILGDASAHAAKSLPALSGAQLILEDLGDGGGTTPFRELATEIAPHTSFVYHSDEFLAGNGFKKGKG